MKNWNDYFGTLEGFEFASWFEAHAHVWGALKEIKPRLDELAAREVGSAALPDGVIASGPVWVGENTSFEPGVYIKGPVWIGDNCRIRHGAYLREYSVIGSGSVVGNSTEVKNSILIGHCEVPHFNYVGDSILGWKAHLGAGVILSNFKQTSGSVTLNLNGEKIDTGLRKFGAVMGDGATAGCNAVLNPGSLIGARSVLYPNINWRGILPADHIAKLRQNQEIVEMRR